MGCKEVDLRRDNCFWSANGLGFEIRPQLLLEGVEAGVGIRLICELNQPVPFGESVDCALDNFLLV